MKRFHVLSIALPILAGCSGGGQSTSALPMIQAAGQLPGASASAVMRAGVEPEAAASAVAQPDSASSNDLLYVGNGGNNSITVYHQSAAGDSVPLDVIAGAKTGLKAPGTLSQDAQGNLYVANDTTSSTPNILVFAHGANGNAAPLRKLDLPAGYTHLEAVTVDKTTGKIFVAADTGTIMTGGIALLRYAPNASGHAVPFANGSINFPALQLDSDSTGNNVIEAHATDAPSDVGYGVETQVKQYPNGASVPIVYDTYWFPTGGVADDPTTKSYLATAREGIYRLAEKTVGSGPDSPGETFAPKPVSIITSDTCGAQLALGYLRNVFVVHAKRNGCAADAVYVYAPTASGKAAPLRVLSGSATRLSTPYGIYEGK